MIETPPDRSAARRALLFVSPQFLFPMDAGGKIRTANILKHMKGGAFRIHLLAPAAAEQAARWRSCIDEVCDDFTAFEPAPGDAAAQARRALGLVSPLPVSVWTDARPDARRAVAAALSGPPAPDLVVFDYIHAMALAPARIPAPSVVFTHNVETEIFERHAKVATGPMKLVYALEAAKMRRFERREAARVDGVLAVSERDAEFFRRRTDARRVAAIPTGVDLEFFSYVAPSANAAPIVVFTGSMDWRANQDGLAWFLDAVWPKIAAARPDASFRVIGKNPPPGLVAAARERGFDWTFTGFVDDVRDHARGAVYVIPLRAGGGTRIKAFEAMAMGPPVVSTALGVEGLGLEAGRHYLEAADAGGFAQRVLSLLEDPARRRALSEAARRHVEAHCAQSVVARAFERHCLSVLDAMSAGAAGPAALEGGR